MITTRAAVLREMGRPAPYASSRPLSIETLQLAPPAEGELLIQVRAAGLCHSDLSVIDGSRPRVMPMVLGHEAAGVVEACGPGVTAFAPGDHVVFSFVPVCGHCDPCASGRAALCEPGAAATSPAACSAARGRSRAPRAACCISISAFPGSRSAPWSPSTRR
jgi:Zn-dependent alcohol dehydrogenase